ncbi:MAG: ribonuclease HII [Candidatus Caldarchaeum sp.]
MAEIKLCGVDEAGRGSVLGPLVISAVLASPPQARSLRSLGVADSKTLTPLRRFELYQKLSEMLVFKTVVLEPWSVDSSLRVNGGEGLNTLEYRWIARLVDALKPDRVFVDSPDRNVAKARRKILSYVKHRAEIRCMVKGDRRNVLVAAASIIAKVERDRHVKRLRELYGDFGSGYPSDPRTRRWLADKLSGNNLPAQVRRGWKTLERLKQSRLDDF